MDEGASPANPVFVGGTGRCGTTVLGALLGRHSLYAALPYELKFHTSRRDGLPALLEGKVPVERFVERMRSFWYLRIDDRGTKRGLNRSMTEEQLEAALTRFQASFDGDPAGASRALAQEVADPVAAREGKAMWVDTTPSTMVCASTLLEIFPSMKIVHMVRDGRDVACSIAPRGWAPNNVPEALHWWARFLRLGEQEGRRLPADRLLVIQFEELVQRDREAGYSRLLEFLELDDERGIRNFFDRRLTEERANIGRWHRDLDGRERQEVERLYGAILEDLRADGVSCAPTERLKKEVGAGAAPRATADSAPPPERSPSGLDEARGLFAEYAADAQRFWTGPGVRQAHKLEKRVRRLSKQLDLPARRAVERVISVADARFHRRPRPVYVSGLGGSGSHWLAGMLSSLEGFVNSEEVYFPTRLLERMRKLRHAQAYVADCVHLLHAWPQTDGLEQHSTVNCAAGAHRAGLYRSWDPEAFVVNLYRDPRDQVMSVVFRKCEYRAYEAPDASDDEYLQRKARHNATHHEAYRRGQPADFECSYEALCASPIETLGDLLERMGTPVAADRLTEVVARHDSGNIRAGTVAPVGNLPSTESPSWDQSVSEQHARVLHSELVQVVEDLGY